jgi:hypothetical protein
MSNRKKNLALVGLVFVAAILLTSACGVPLVQQDGQDTVTVLIDPDRASKAGEPFPAIKNGKVSEAPPSVESVLKPLDNPVREAIEEKAEPVVESPRIDDPNVELPPEEDLAQEVPPEEVPVIDDGTIPDIPESDQVPYYKPPVPELKLLAELEGKKDFSTSSHMYSSYNLGQGRGQGNGGTAAGEADSKEREVEEADIVKLKGNILYILNPYRGLIIVDLKEPDNPVIISNMPILGYPVDMYIFGQKAYMIVTCNYGYWYMYASMGLWWGWENIHHRIGSRLVIADIADPTEPTMIREISLNGFVTDSRRVGDVLYYVTTCPKWYNWYAGTTMDDKTYVTSINIADLCDIFIIESISFEGVSNEIHVTSEYLYVSKWSYTRENRYGRTNITLVDISDPMGMIGVRDEFSVDGRVFDRYQMDHFGDTFRVVSHFRRGMGESKLWTFDVTDPDDVKPLGQLLIDDAGNLMATRFAGERAYTIHLPRAIDPLDVLDLSDPADPKLCDVFEMPGWITHMEVRGMKILALGVDDSSGRRKVAVSIFDVSDPWNAVMEDRVQIGDGWSWSGANWDPKALTVLDDHGLVLVPFCSYGRDEDGRYYYQSGVQVVAFDLKAGDLELCGSIDQPDNVLRTRSLGARILSTSRDYLIVADMVDLSDPRVTAMIELCPWVRDFRSVEGSYAEIVLRSSDSMSYLRVFDEGSSDLSDPDWEVNLGADVIRWFWDGHLLHVVAKQVDAYNHVSVTVTTYDLLDSSRHLSSWTNFEVGQYDSYSAFNSWRWDTNHNWYMMFGDYWYYYQENNGVDNPVMLDDGTIALYGDGKLFLVGVDGCRAPFLIEDIEVECDGFYGILPAGKDLYLVRYQDHYEYAAYEYKSKVRVYRMRLTEFLVYPVRINTFVGPGQTEWTKVPGVPQGASEDGSTIYTSSRWWFDTTFDANLYLDAYNFKDTLNVVRIQEGEATVVRAFDVSGKTFRVTGDTAVISEVVSQAYEQADGTEMSVYYTNVFIVDLKDCVLQETFQFVGYHNLLWVGSDLVILSDMTRTGLVIIDIAEPEDAVVRSFKVRPWGYGLFRDGQKVFISQGKYGVQCLDLSA